VEAARRVASAHALTEHDLRGERIEAERVVAGLKGKAAALLALGPLAVTVARELAPELPLVACMAPDLKKLGIEPGPGLSGVVYGVPVRNQLAAFRMVNPRATRIGVIYSPDAAPLVEEARRAAPVVRLALVEKPVASGREVPQALREILSGGDAADALWLPPDPVLIAEEARRFLLAETLKAGKAIYTFSPAIVAEGALVSQGPDPVSTGEQAGDLLNRMLGAEKGARIDFQYPRAELVINKKIADKLRIPISAEAQKAASRVY
jgi:putative ABC transport system substrate-binding protein